MKLTLTYRSFKLIEKGAIIQFPNVNNFYLLSSFKVLLFKNKLLIFKLVPVFSKSEGVIFIAL